MKKSITKSTRSTTFITGVSLLASGMFTLLTHAQNKWPETSLGTLAQLADAAGIGHVVDMEMPFIYINDSRRIPTEHPFGYANILVEQAFVGCTNGQTIRVYRWPLETAPEVGTNIVFVATTNDTFYSWGTGRWDVPYGSVWSRPYREEEYVPDEYKPIYELKHERRSWWYVDDAEGQLRLDFLTNAIQHVRIERNWTNYYHLVRDGFNSPSSRIREDVRTDLSGLMRSVPTDAHHEYMRDDPLFPEFLRTILEQEIELRAQQQ